MEEVIIIGVGAAGLSAAIELAKNGVKSILVADMPSEHSQLWLKAVLMQLFHLTQILLSFMQKKH